MSRRAPRSIAFTRAIALAFALSIALAGCTAAGGSPPSPLHVSSAPPTTASTALPPVPRTLFEWYPQGGDQKTIVASDAAASAPAVPVVPQTEDAEVHANWARNGSEFVWEVLAEGEASTIWTARADGSEATLEASCPGDPCVEMSWPSYSPDGSHLLVTRYDKVDDNNWGQSHLVSVERATGEQTILASTADGTTAFYSASWSPNGTHIAAQLETYPDATESEISGSAIVVVDADPATTDAPVPITNPALFAGYPRWHPNDWYILFSSWDLNAFQGNEASQLYLVNPDGGDLSQLTFVDPDSGTRPGEASWTPDGTRIIAGLGIVSAGEVTDVKISFVDPVSGAISPTAQSGAMPTLQPTP